MTFDELRASQPELGFYAYAADPNGPVTLEIQTPDGALYSFSGPTLSAAINAAFPPPPPEPETPPTPTPAVNVFD